MVLQKTSSQTMKCLNLFFVQDYIIINNKLNEFEETLKLNLKILLFLPHKKKYKMQNTQNVYLLSTYSLR